MSRFVTAFGWEMRIQWRQGIHYAALVMVLIWVVALARMPEDLRALLLPFGLNFTAIIIRSRIRRRIQR